MIIDLPKSHYRVLAPKKSEPSKFQIYLGVVAVVTAVILFAIF
jgi:hypothetical protein